MENLRQIVKQVPGELSKTCRDSSRGTAEERALVIAKWLSLGKEHYRLSDEISDVNAEIYLSGLRDIEPSRIDEAFSRCFKECDFFPKLADVFRLMPERRAIPIAVERFAKFLRDRGIEAEEWDEETGGVRYHFYGQRNGYKCIVKSEAL